MELFHGTPKSRGDIIIKEKRISCHAKPMFEDGCEDILQSAEYSDNLIKPKTLSTTPGYVYLSDLIFNAMYYGNVNAFSNDEDYFYLFKVELPEEVLEPDEDEIRMVLCKDPMNYPSVKDSLNACHSVRYNNDIISFEYCILPAAANFSHPNSQLVRDMINLRPRARGSATQQNVVDLMNQFYSNVSWIKI